MFKDTKDLRFDGPVGGGIVSEFDSVNHPKHYKQHPSGIECIQIKVFIFTYKFILHCELKFMLDIALEFQAKA